MSDRRFEFALVGYYLWSQAPDDPVETILLPSGWVESASPFIPGVAGLVCDEDFLFTALPSGMAKEFARGFDEPDERLCWFLRQRAVPT